MFLQCPEKTYPNIIFVLFLLKILSLLALYLHVVTFNQRVTPSQYMGGRHFLCQISINSLTNFAPRGKLTNNLIYF